MVEPRYTWRYPAPRAIDAALVEVGSTLGLSPRVVELLVRRGVTRPEDLQSFQATAVSGLHDPGLLPDAEAVVRRVDAAARGRELVMVAGDFDADGLTGLAILTRALRALDIAVDPHVPSRVDDGHGLSTRAIDRAVALGATLIITVDTGSSSTTEIDLARARGIDVIVTDHHRVPDPAPRALALVNPARPGSPYPEWRLAGSGVALKVAQLLLGAIPGPGPAAALELADLAAIGSVADVAPIIGENRSIARLGLDLLRARPRPGLRALLERGGLDGRAITLETIAFAIAPRLNAAGRIGEAQDAADLLLSDDPVEAARLADVLELANATRRDVSRAVTDEARALIEPDRSLVALHGPWPIGILGPVAGRLAEETGRPVIVGAELGEVIRASCRGNGELDLAAALAACSELLVRHGGHRGAAGFEIRADRWDALVERLRAAADELGEPPRPGLDIDLALPSAAIGYGLLRELAVLAPTGPGNPDPLLGIHGLTVTRARAVTGGHTQITMRRERDVLDAIAFERPDLASGLSEGDRVDIVARLASRTFGGFESLQLDVRDVASSGWHAAPPVPAAVAWHAGARP